MGGSAWPGGWVRYDPATKCSVYPKTVLNRCRPKTIVGERGGKGARFLTAQGAPNREKKLIYRTVGSMCYS